MINEEKPSLHDKKTLMLAINGFVVHSLFLLPCGFGTVLCLLLSGGINLMTIRIILENLSRFRSLKTMNPVDQLFLCQCSELHKGMPAVQ